MAFDFSELADKYAEFRPRYPKALFAWIAEIAPVRDVALELGCGSGQASQDLSAYFNRVISSDRSYKPITKAPADPKIAYHVGTAENMALADDSVDMVVSAQAAHWFQFDAFYEEVRRVTKPGGVIALWCYQFFSLPEQPVIMDRVEHFKERVHPYWAPERAYTDAGYRNLPFPFTKEIEPPEFQIEGFLDLPNFLGYLSSWSATDLFKKANAGIDPVADLERELEPLWGKPDEPHKITFPVCMRVARL